MTDFFKPTKAKIKITIILVSVCLLASVLNSAFVYIRTEHVTNLLQAQLGEDYLNKFKPLSEQYQDPEFMSILFVNERFLYISFALITIFVIIVSYMSSCLIIKIASTDNDTVARR